MHEFKYHTGFKRILAAFVDGVIFIPVYFFIQWISVNSESNSLNNFLQVVLVFLPIFYSVILHYKFGQTYGKWVTGVKVIDTGEIKNISLKQSIFRDIFYIVLAIIGVCYSIFQGSQGFFINSDDSVSTMPLFIWNLLEIFVMFINPKRRTIHDYLAKSVVVRTGSI